MYYSKKSVFSWGEFENIECIEKLAKWIGTHLHARHL